MIMPYKWSYDPAAKFVLKDLKRDRRIRLYPEDKERIRELHSQGVPIRQIARMFKVSKRLIQFTVYPERLQHNTELHKLRGYSYNTKRHTEAVRKHRRYKQEVFKSLIIATKEQRRINNHA